MVALIDEDLPGAEPLLKKVMERGAITEALPSLESIRKTFLDEFARLPDAIKAIRNPAVYPVEFTARLQTLRLEIEKKVSGA
jgi:hypothetical protein